MVTARKREFRTQDSFDAEAVSRDIVRPFLESRGFNVEDDHRTQTGTAISQVVTAVYPHGNRIRMRVRLCWRWNRHGKENNYSAAQLRARLIDGDWEKTLDAIVLRDVEKDISHMLVLQRNDNEVAYAALIPITELKNIWEKQRDISTKLIESGKMGRIGKNHAMNGESPTVWLMDKRTPAAHAVPDALWSWPGVADMVKLPAASAQAPFAVDDTFDDIPGVDYSDLGSDGSPRRKAERSYVKRDPAVRREVIKRAKNQCEREGCKESRDYTGFLDVHHILGVEKSDRVWNCVALCPNCHREAHFSPDCDQINEQLLKFASRYKKLSNVK